jgi:rod shape-determining protein MreC
LKYNLRSANRFTAPLRGVVHRFAYPGLLLMAVALMFLGKADAVLVERFRAQVMDALAPIIDAMSRPASATSKALDKISEMKDLKAENDRLREKTLELSKWQEAARRLDAENRSFRSLLRFIPEPEAKFITARVIADGGGAFVHSLLLNAGTNAGVRKGQAVVDGDGLIGRVASVGKRSVRVLLITDMNSRIPVLVESSRARAILAGTNSDEMRLVYLSPEFTPSSGDRIVTSGHGGVFPPGLPVGEVLEVGKKGALVRSFMKRDKVEYVRVVDYDLRGILEFQTTGQKASQRVGAPENKIRKEVGPTR